MEVKSMNIKRQKGEVVIAGLAILVVAVAVGLFGGVMTAHKQQQAEAAYQQQQINTIKSGGLNDGRVDW